MSHHKTKLTVKRDPGQACVVADLEVFQHIIETYNYMGDSAADAAEKVAWYNVAEIFAEWLEKTYLPLEDELSDDFS